MASQASQGREANSRRLVVVMGLILGSLIVLNLPSGAQRTIAHWVRQTVLSPFIEINTGIMRVQARARDFDVLRAQMDSSLALVSRQRTLAEENRQLRGVLSLKNRSPARYMATTVIRSGTSGSESVFHLDVGSAEGIPPFSAVVTEAGLLGQVQEVRAEYSLAYDWSHRDFRVSAMTMDGLDHGLIEAARGQFREQDRLILRGTDYLSDVAPGTELMTSGRGGAFPRGIRIGWVVGVAEVSAGWSKSYFVEPAVDPGSATYAIVDIGVADEITLVTSPDSASTQPLGGRL